MSIQDRWPEADREASSRAGLHLSDWATLTLTRGLLQGGPGTGEGWAVVANLGKLRQDLGRRGVGGEESVPWS